MQTPAAAPGAKGHGDPLAAPVSLTRRVPGPVAWGNVASGVACAVRVAGGQSASGCGGAVSSWCAKTSLRVWLTT